MLAGMNNYAAEFASKGGKARAAKLSKARQSEIAKMAASERWKGHTPGPKARKRHKIQPVPKSFSAR